MPPLMSSLASITRLPEGLATEVLVKRALEGDRTAESHLYRRFASGVLVTALRLLRSRSAAEDIVQDAFVIGFARLSQLKTRAQFRPWLLSIVVSQARKRLRRERLLQWVGLEAVAEAPLHLQAMGSASVEARGELAVLDGLLRQLPVAHRLAWTLRYVEGEKLDDVAAVMGKSLATTKRYLLAAEQKIAAHVSLDPLGTLEVDAKP